MRGEHFTGYREGINLFLGNTNVTKVIPTKTMVTQQWFLDVLHSTEPVDIFIVIGHNPARPSDTQSTFSLVFDAIRAVHPDSPIQFLGSYPSCQPRNHQIYTDKIP